MEDWDEVNFLEGISTLFFLALKSPLKYASLALFQ